MTAKEIAQEVHDAVLDALTRKVCNLDVEFTTDASQGHRVRVSVGSKTFHRLQTGLASSQRQQCLIQKSTSR